MTPASVRDATHTPEDLGAADLAHAWPDRTARQANLVVSVVMAGTGLSMIGMAIGTHVGPARKAVETFLGLVVVVSAALLVRSRTKTAEEGAGVLPGDLCLAGALLYLGVAMPTVGHGTGRSQAVGQFIAVVLALVVGCAGLIYSRAPVGQPRRLSFSVMVRDGVLLITGTILAAIATGQIANPALKAPKWNWVSFLALTVPGMLVLVGREGVKQTFERHDRSRPSARLARTGIVELLLVVGLGIMLFGSNANLALGKNGYQTGLKGNAEGLTLWLAAAAFLIIVRGAAKAALASTTARFGASVVSSVLYVAGVLALIYGERSVQMGKDPVVAFGAALVPAALMLAGGMAVLVLMRPAARALDVVAVQGSPTRLTVSTSQSSPNRT